MVLSQEYCGKKFEDKLVDLRKEMDKKKSAGFVVCESVKLMAVNVR